jgi:hypothetical protein
MRAERSIDGIPVNPVLPKQFYGTDNQKRRNSPWWFVLYVRIYPCPYEEGSEYLAKWLEAWPSGNRFDTYCLDGGAWDRPTTWGKFGTLEEAIACAKIGPTWRR